MGKRGYWGSLRRHDKQDDDTKEQSLVCRTTEEVAGGQGVVQWLLCSVNS